MFRVSSACSHLMGSLELKSVELEKIQSGTKWLAASLYRAAPLTFDAAYDGLLKVILLRALDDGFTECESVVLPPCHSVSASQLRLDLDADWMRAPGRLVSAVLNRKTRLGRPWLLYVNFFVRTDVTKSGEYRDIQTRPLGGRYTQKHRKRLRKTVHEQK